MNSPFPICISALFLFCSGNAAFAQGFLERAQQCADAIQSEDKSTAELIAREITGWQSFKGAELREMAEACIEYGLGGGWSYSFGKGRMVSSDEVAKMEADRINSNTKAVEENQQRIEAGKAKIAAKEAMVRQQKMAEAEQELKKQLRIEQVTQAVAGACFDLFWTDRNTALTNTLCVDVFMETGLPTR